MSTLTWLHLSDLHFRATQAYDERIVLQALLRDVTDRPQQDGLRPDFVAVSGDVAFSGQPAEYELARQFFDDLLATAGLGKDRLFLVPGNHDVDRSRVSPGARAIGDSLADRETASAVLASPGDRQLMLARLEGYATFANNYLASSLSSDGEEYYFVRRLDLAGLQVALLGLNSAWASASDQDQAQGLLLGERQVRAALDLAEGAALKIALLHHPFDWLRAFDRADVEPLLCDRCNFVLHGHMHQAGLLRASSPDGEAMIVAAGACYHTRHYPNSYNYVRLDPAAEGGAGQGRVYLRRYSDQRGGFWAKDTQTYRNVPDGVFEFSLPAGLRLPASSEEASDEQRGASSASQDIRVDSAGGAVYGDVRVEGSQFVGRDLNIVYHLHPSGRQPSSPEEYNLAAIRTLLRDAFTDRELQRFCHDRPQFHPVLSQLGANASLEETIDAVITYCEKRLLLSELLAEVERFNPRQYRRHAARLVGSD
jgi:3',5'-cyclic AMP phosphodiesterase CpdA